MKRAFLLNLLTALLIALVAAAGIFLRIRVLSAVEDDSPAPEPDPSSFVYAAVEDLSAGAEPMIDGDGVLHVPDNAVIDEVDVPVIRTSCAVFAIPDSWVGNVVIESQASVGAESGVAADSRQRDTQYRFFEKQTYRKYRTQEHFYDKDSDTKGLLTVLTFAASEEKKKQLLSRPSELRFMEITGTGPVRTAFLLQQSRYGGCGDREFYDAYRGMIEADYVGAILSSIETDGGVAVYTTTWAEELAGRYGDGLTSLALTEDVPYPVSTEAPPAASYEPVPSSYPWHDFSSPWTYPDAGNMYEFGSPESGGTVQTDLRGTENTEQAAPVVTPGIQPPEAAAPAEGTDDTRDDTGAPPEETDWLLPVDGDTEVIEPEIYADDGGAVILDDGIYF